MSEHDSLSECESVRQDGHMSVRARLDHLPQFSYSALRVLTLPHRLRVPLEIFMILVIPAAS